MDGEKLYACVTKLDKSEKGAKEQSHIYPLYRQADVPFGKEGEKPAKIDSLDEAEEYKIKVFSESRALLPVEASAFGVDQSRETDDSAYKKRPFLCLADSVRIRAKVDGVEFSTTDIPIRGSGKDNSENLRKMLKVIASHGDKRGPAVSMAEDWMFANRHPAITGKKSDEASDRYLQLNVALDKGSTAKSDSTTLQLLKKVIEVYRSNLGYFSRGRHERVEEKCALVSYDEIRRMGTEESLWLAQNSWVFARPVPMESQRCSNRAEGEMGVLGGYLPLRVRTSIKATTCDTYENALLLGFLEKVLAEARTRLASARALGCREKANPKDHTRIGATTEDCVLPALLLNRLQHEFVDDCGYLDEFEGAVQEVEVLLRRYKSLFAGVRPSFSVNPRRSKAFAEIKPYRDVFNLIVEWIRHGDFSLDGAELVVQTSRLDKLYEYYVLRMLLEWLAAAGFTGESSYIEDAPEETRVATYYDLHRGDERVRLLYQPRVYGDDRHMTIGGDTKKTDAQISLRRLHSGFCKSIMPWKPDFIVEVTKDGHTSFHIADAKYSRLNKLLDRWPLKCPNGKDSETPYSESQFGECLRKYYLETGSPSEHGKSNYLETGSPSEHGKSSGDVQSVWLFSGRPSDEDSERPSAEVHFLLPRNQVLWFAALYRAMRFGGAWEECLNLSEGPGRFAIGQLVPDHSCLDEYFKFLGIECRP